MAANTEYTKIKESAISAFFSKLKAAFWPKADVTNVTLADVAVTGDYDDLINKPTIPGGGETPIETSYPSGGFRPNTIYDLGTLTGTQTFALYTTGLDATVKNEWVWSFKAGSTAPTITWPSGITWDGGSAPTVNASSLYEISVRLIGSYYVGYYKEVAL